MNCITSLQASIFALRKEFFSPLKQAGQGFVKHFLKIIQYDILAKRPKIDDPLTVLTIRQ